MLITYSLNSSCCLSLSNQQFFAWIGHAHYHKHFLLQCTPFLSHPHLVHLTACPQSMLASQSLRKGRKIACCFLPFSEVLESILWGRQDSFLACPATSSFHPWERGEGSLPQKALLTALLQNNQGCVSADVCVCESLSVLACVCMFPSLASPPPSHFSW